MRQRFGILSPVIIGFVFAGAALAQSRDENLALCSGSDLDLKIAGCSALIQSGQESTATLSLALNNRGRAYIEKGEHDNAIRDFDRSIEINPNDAVAFRARGRAFNSKGQYDRALEDIDHALALDPNDAIAFYHRGVAYYGKNDYERAIREYDQAIRLNPDMALAFNNRGFTYASKGEHDRGIQDYTRAIALDSKLVLPLTNRGDAYTAKGEYDRAIRDYTQAITLAPNSAIAFNNRGFAHWRKGEHDRAVQDYTRAIALDPNAPIPLHNRALAYGSKGEHDLAVRDYTQAVTLDASRATTSTERSKAYSRTGPLTARTSSALVVSEAQAGGATPPTPAEPLEVPHGDYPLESLVANEEGTVTLSLNVDGLGRIAEVRTVRSSGYEQLDRAAADVAKQRWQFKPATKDGQPAAGSVNVDVSWNLPLEPAPEYQADEFAIGGVRGAVDFKPPVPVTSHTVAKKEFAFRALGRNHVLIFRYLVLENGTVGETQIIGPSGHRTIDDTTTGLVKARWRFLPAMLNGRPIKSWQYVQFSFGRMRREPLPQYCTSEPVLGSPMQRAPERTIGYFSGGFPAINDSYRDPRASDDRQRIHINRDGTIDDTIFRTRKGWMRFTGPALQQLSVTFRHPPAAAADRPDSCWVGGNMERISLFFSPLPEATPEGL